MDAGNQRNMEQHGLPRNYIGRFDFLWAEVLQLDMRQIVVNQGQPAQNQREWEGRGNQAFENNEIAAEVVPDINAYPRNQANHDHQRVPIIDRKTLLQMALAILRDASNFCNEIFNHLIMFRQDTAKYNELARIERESSDVLSKLDRSLNDICSRANPREGYFDIQVENLNEIGRSLRNLQQQLNEAIE